MVTEDFLPSYLFAKLKDRFLILMCLSIRVSDGNPFRIQILGNWQEIKKEHKENKKAGIMYPERNQGFVLYDRHITFWNIKKQ